MEEFMQIGGRDRAFILARAELRFTLKAQGKTQEQLAAEIGITGPGLSAKFDKQTFSVWEELANHDPSYAAITAGLFNAASLLYVDMVPAGLLASIKDIGQTPGAVLQGSELEEFRAIYSELGSLIRRAEKGG